MIEATKNSIIQKSKASNKGKQRFNRRLKSKVANQVKQFNDINMDKLFKEDILDIGLSVRGESHNYIVKISFSGLLEEVRKKVEKLNKIDIGIILNCLIKCFTSNDVYMHCSCLHPDTKIRLLSGEVITVKEMEARYANGEKMYVYSADSNGDFKPGEVEKVWITGYESDLIKVTLDNGESIITTPNHPYMLRNGSYCIADHLEVGQSLMPMYMSNTANGYDTVKLNSANVYFGLNHKITSIEHIHLDEAIPVYDIKVKDWENFTVDAGVVLHNCPDWRFRFDYLAREKHKTNSTDNPDDPQNRAPVKTNPDDTLGSGCKHTLLVLSNRSWLIKVASVINNYIIYMQKHYEKQYADIIYPVLFGKKYEEPVQLSIDDIDNTDGLGTSTDIIDKSNEYGRTRTQFQKGNTQGIRFASSEKENPDQMNLNI